MTRGKQGNWRNELLPFLDYFFDDEYHLFFKLLESTVSDDDKMAVSDDDNDTYVLSFILYTQNFSRILLSLQPPCKLKI